MAVRITFVVHQFPPHCFTGTEQYALAVGRELQRCGHDVDGELLTAGDAADLATRLQRLVDEPERLARDREAVQPPKALAAAVDEFEALCAGAARG